jgi:hypothetical protein
MNLAQAIKRSYHFFIPPSLLAPRQWVGRIFQPAFFYVIGLSTGMYAYARPGEGQRITSISIVAMFGLLVLKWWSGASTQGGSTEGGKEREE